VIITRFHITADGYCTSAYLTPRAFHLVLGLRARPSRPWSLLRLVRRRPAKTHVITSWISNKPEIVPQLLFFHPLFSKHPQKKPLNSFFMCPAFKQREVIHVAYKWIASPNATTDRTTATPQDTLFPFSHPLLRLLCLNQNGTTPRFLRVRCFSTLCMSNGPHSNGGSSY
jgi:hypothetical protein